MARKSIGCSGANRLATALRTGSDGSKPQCGRSRSVRPATILAKRGNKLLAAPIANPEMAGSKLLSATRLAEFMGCPHRVALWLAGEAPSDPQDETQALLWKKGLEHEATVLERLEQRVGQQAVRIPASGVSIEDRVRLTIEAIQQGAEIIYQGALTAGRWIGFPDFLLRSATAGNRHYRAEDAKLSKKAKRDHVLQIGVYAQLLNRVLGIPIVRGVVHVSASEPERFDLRETEYITARLMRRLEEFADNEHRSTRALKCGACERCGYRSRCEDEWRKTDSPIFVAGLRSSQLLKLEAAGVETMSDLAQLAPGTVVKGIGQETVPKLAAQARLQKRAQQTGVHSAEVLPVEPGRGFCLLPSPQPGDLFLDLEGDPLYPGGLEYLFGVYGLQVDSDRPVYLPFWAHTLEEEKAAFEQVMRTISAHLAKFPDAHIFHFAQYEPTAFKRLAMRHGAMEAELDDLLRNHRFVDLYRVVRQGIRASTESYALKDLEKIYWGGRAGQVASAGDSIVQYEKWRLTQDASVLAEIAKYNEEDCVSTAMMRDWLDSLRPATAVYQQLSTISKDGEREEARSEEREANEQSRRQLAVRVRTSGVADERIRELVADLLWFHQRAQKPAWWALFERQTWSDEELAEDAESLGGITFDALASVECVKRSYLLTCRFPPQDTKLKLGGKPVMATTLEPAGTIENIRPEEGLLVLRRAVGRDDLPSEFSLLPSRPLKQQVLIDAVTAFAERFASGRLEEDRALMDFLLRDSPRVRGRQTGAELVAGGKDLIAETIRVIHDLDHTTLFIQGPPGSGKTFTASHAILALLKAGKRVGVASNSHKAINNLLFEIEKRATENNLSFVGAKKASQEDPDSDFEGRFINSVRSSSEVNSQHQLIGGTVFHFAQEGLDTYDYLFVDEAGQVALGNLVAMAGCAKNLVLIGDQMQLAQPIQGMHPGETGHSCLQYLLQRQATIAPDKGILLNVSYRMHPSICQFISDAIYDGRLTSAESAAKRQLILGDSPHGALQPAGISFYVVEHKGCTQSSAEEAAAVRAIVNDLLRHAFRDENGTVRPIILEDILVVAPFNMQVNLLKRMLPDCARIGTVDKFQGQEAPVVIVSMATSHGDEAPRGTEFLFNRNRFNVAISRAQCLAIVVQSPRLQDVSVGSIDDLARLNLFARAEAGAKRV